MDLSTDSAKSSLCLIEALHQCTTTESLVDKTIYGIGALIPSVSCAWTEITSDTFYRGKPNIDGNVTDPAIDLENEIDIFEKLIYQHPCIAKMFESRDQSILAVSDCISQAEYRDLPLYRHFYQRFTVEDQLTATYLDEHGTLIGLSVNRDYWGFEPSERAILNTITTCAFTLYRACKLANIETVPKLAANIDLISSSHQLLGITPRECEVLARVAHGESNKAIAKHLVISEGTVRKHLENLFKHLSVTNRVSAVLRAIETIQTDLATRPAIPLPAENLPLRRHREHRAR